MPVCIAGMHRSGTSMVAKALREAGLALGPPDALMPASDENPEGYWEHLGFVELNDSLLNEAGGSWDCPPPASVDWAGDALAPFRLHAAALAAEFAGQEPWGWKDPRNCLALPFWQSALGPLGVVFVVRNPLEVARSLHRRNGFSLALGLTLWWLYARRLLDATTPATRVVTHFDAYFGDAGPEVRRVLAALDLPVPGAGVASPAPATDALKHHRLTLADLVEARVAPEVVALYLELCDEAKWHDPLAASTLAAPAGRRTLDEHLAGGPGLGHAGVVDVGVGRIDRLAVDVQVLRRDLDEHRRALTNRQGRVMELESALRLHEESRAELEGKLIERDGRIADRERKLVEADAAYQRLLREVRSLRGMVMEQKERSVAATQQIEMQARYERELRGMLDSLHEQLLNKDAEVMGTLGAALARAAPGAPAAIYYRQLLGRVRELVAARLPAAAPILVATYGDDAMLELDGRPALPYPQADGGVAADYTSVDSSVAIAQLEFQRSRGVGFLVVPSPAQAWLLRYPDIQRYLDDRYPAIVHEQGWCTIYDLGSPASVAA